MFFRVLTSALVCYSIDGKIHLFWPLHLGWPEFKYLNRGEDREKQIILASRFCAFHHCLPLSWFQIRPCLILPVASFCFKRLAAARLLENICIRARTVGVSDQTIGHLRPSQHSMLHLPQSTDNGTCFCGPN